MVTSVTPVPEQQHMPRAQARAGGQDVHVRFDFGAYIDPSTSTTQLANETPDQSHVAARNRAGEYCCNQQYSVTAITTSTGTIAERYAYSAYGQPTILDASGSVLSTSSIYNRYTYTGREWDATLGLHHFRARWMSPSAGRFLGRDPIGFRGRSQNLSAFVNGNALVKRDPTGLRPWKCECDCVSGQGGFRYPGRSGQVEAATVNEAQQLCNDFCSEFDNVSADHCAGKLDTLEAACGKASCPQCPSSKCFEYISRIRNVILSINNDVPRFDWEYIEKWHSLDKCARWTDKFCSRIDPVGKLNFGCLKSIRKYRWQIGGAFNAHVAAQLTLCNGSVVYIDDNWLGGKDQTFTSDDIPINYKCTNIQLAWE